jgi:nucleoside-diphosphate-sugar epimerase
MPVIVVGADTVEGTAIVEGLLDPAREIRVFVSDEDAGARFRKLGAKVALGDVSDDSHVEAAATRCFTAVLVTNAIDDGREIGFATSRKQVLDGWAAAVANVQRVIWVDGGEVPDVKPGEVAKVDPSVPDLVTRVIDLDEARSL